MAYSVCYLQSILPAQRRMETRYRSHKLPDSLGSIFRERDAGQLHAQPQIRQDWSRQHVLNFEANRLRDFY